MSIRSAARNLRRASRNASSGVGRRGAASPVSSRWRRVGAVLMGTGRSLAGVHDNGPHATARLAVACPLQCRAVAAREEYPHSLVIPTRWKDNDVYGHVNNVEYYSYFDTVINEYLISEGGLDIHEGGVIGVCAESHCEYHGPISFPESIDACLRIGKLGRSSSR